MNPAVQPLNDELDADWVKLVKDVFRGYGITNSFD